MCANSANFISWPLLNLSTTTKYMMKPMRMSFRVYISANIANIGASTVPINFCVCGIFPVPRESQLPSHRTHFISPKNSITHQAYSVSRRKSHCTEQISYHGKHLFLSTGFHSIEIIPSGQQLIHGALLIPKSAFLPTKNISSH